MKGLPKAQPKGAKQKMKELDTQLQNMQMALQMNQNMVKYLLDQLKAVQSDLGSTMGMVNDFQYRTLAMLDLGEFNLDDIDNKSQQIKLKDFNDASEKENKIKGYILDNDSEISEETIVTLTSNTPDLDENLGIFRSKFPMSECLTPHLKEALLGKKCNETFTVDIGGISHHVTILDLYKLPEQKEQE